MISSKNHLATDCKKNGEYQEVENTGQMHCPVLLSFLYRTKSQNTGLSGEIPDTWQPYANPASISAAFSSIPLLFQQSSSHQSRFHISNIFYQSRFHFSKIFSSIHNRNSCFVQNGSINRIHKA